ncbi:MAG: hypothetical protein RSA08_04400 [Clostridia bacterium]
MKIKLNKGIKKNLNKILKIQNENQNYNKKGAALAESVLLIAISLVLVIVIFYPQITSLFNTLILTMTTWFNKAISVIGTV